MAIGTPYTIVGGNANTGSATLQVTVSATSAAGDAIVVAASSTASGVTVTGVTDSQGNTYTSAVSDYNQSIGIGAFTALNTAALTNGVDWIKATFSNTTGIKALNGRGCSGIAASSAVDKTSSNDSAASTAISTGSSGTLTQANEWAVAFSASGNAGGAPTSWTGGFTAADTEHFSGNQYQVVADQVVSATTALNAGATVVSTKWAALLVTLKGAAVTLTNSFEGGSNTTTITTGNSGGASGNAFNQVFIGTGAGVTFSNTHAAHGTLACKLATGASAVTAFTQWDAALGSGLNQVWFRTYLYFTANPASAFGLVRYLTASGGSQVARLALQASGHVVFTDGSNTNQLISTNTIPLNAWFRIEGYATGSSTTGQLEFKLFNSPDSTSPQETQTSAASLNTTGLIGAIGYGIVGTAIASETFWQDDLGASTSGYIGPAGAAAAAANFFLLFP